MQTAALKEILKIHPKDLQDNCYHISKTVLIKLKELGFKSDLPIHRAKHLFGLKIPKHINLELLKAALHKANIHMSFRSDYIQISCDLSNTTAHFKNSLKQSPL